MNCCLSSELLDNFQLNALPKIEGLLFHTVTYFDIGLEERI